MFSEEYEKFRPATRQMQGEFDAIVNTARSPEAGAEALQRWDDLVTRWIDQPGFWHDSSSFLQTTLFDQVFFRVEHPVLGAAAQRWIREFAARPQNEPDQGGVRCLLRICIFEVCAEPPEYPFTLRFLFSLESDPKTRWAVFAGHEHWPGRFRTHIRKYSSGAITERDYLDWLESLYLEPPRIPRRRI